MSTDPSPPWPVPLPGLVIAAPRSGAGKTTVTLGLLRALARSGRVVQPFKCGPDYIDPAFHAVAAGRPSVNLDSWAMRRATATALITLHGAGADLALAEGLMGLFDGVATPGAWGSGASADLAALTGWPVVLVLDVAGQSQTAAAVALGCARYRPDVTVAGVILNRVGSDRHRRLAGEAIERLGIPVFGALPRTGSVTLPERHLGLVQAEETAALDAHLAAIADLVERHVDLARVAAAAAAQGSGTRDQGSGIGERGVSAEPAAPRTTSHVPDPGRLIPDSWSLIPVPGQRIALARDAAFSFVYPHLLALWRRAGAEIVPFSPLADEAPDPAADVAWLPGGYPELHAGTLAANAGFAEGMRRFAATRPVHGECGGYMALGAGLIDAGGHRHAMLGLLGLESSFASRRLHLGYRRARLAAGCPLGPAGTMLAGHEFHYASVLAEPDPPLVEAFDAGGNPVAERGARRGRVTGTFFHLIDRAEP